MKPTLKMKRISSRPDFPLKAYTLFLVDCDVRCIRPKRLATGAKPDYSDIKAGRMYHATVNETFQHCGETKDRRVVVEHTIFDRSERFLLKPGWTLSVSGLKHQWNPALRWNLDANGVPQAYFNPDNPVDPKLTLLEAFYMLDGMLADHPRSKLMRRHLRNLVREVETFRNPLVELEDAYEFYANEAYHAAFQNGTIF
ncbi:MAG TPA: hypothetical protein VMU07_03375 [Candidatus Paceibacterota bacterium]|nr:hypothetical protein [Candidatus Paceibacterota bacterium]